jgi:hypothetical protein
VGTSHVGREVGNVAGMSRGKGRQGAALVCSVFSLKVESYFLSFGQQLICVFCRPAGNMGDSAAGGGRNMG